VLAYSADRRGRPLTLTAHLAVETSAQAGMQAGADAGGLSAAMARGAAVELDATLDLQDTANVAETKSVLDALVHPGLLSELPARVRALAARFRADGEIDRRIYALQRSTTGVAIGLGARAGAAFERTTSGLRLLSAETRLPGLPFLPRDDCRPA
jgi:hypothetical protein